MPADDKWIVNNYSRVAGVKCFNVLQQSQHFLVDFSLYNSSFFIILQTRTYEVTTQKLEYGLINLFCALGTCCAKGRCYITSAAASLYKYLYFSFMLFNLNRPYGCLYSQQPVPPIVCVFDKQTFLQEQQMAS